MAASIRVMCFKFAVFGILLSALVAPPSGLVTPANAQDARSDQQSACSRDVSRHCRKLMNDGDMAIFQCLKQNHDKLSPACRKMVDSH